MLTKNLKSEDNHHFDRAIADQLQGNEGEHSKYRSMVVQYIVVSVLAHKESNMFLAILSTRSILGFYRRIVKCSSLLSKTMFHSRIIVKPWTMMALGLGIWSYKQLLLSHAVIYVSTG